jgi:hypothetical protein
MRVAFLAVKRMTGRNVGLRNATNEKEAWSE